MLHIMSGRQQQPHISDIYIHIRHMCCERCCDKLPRAGCYGNVTHLTSSLFTCGSCGALTKACFTLLLFASRGEQSLKLSVTPRIRCLSGGTQWSRKDARFTTSLDTRPGVCSRLSRAVVLFGWVVVRGSEECGGGGPLCRKRRSTR